MIVSLSARVFCAIFLTFSESCFNHQILIFQVSFGTVHASFGTFADDTKGKVMANRGQFVGNTFSFDSALLFTGRAKDLNIASLSPGRSHLAAHCYSKASSLLQLLEAGRDH